MIAQTMLSIYKIICGKCVDVSLKVYIDCYNSVRVFVVYAMTFYSMRLFDLEVELNCELLY